MAKGNHSRRIHAAYGDSGGSRYAEEMGGRHDEAEHYGEDWRDEDRDEMSEMGRVGHFVSERPHASLMAAFGFGFGLGLMVTLLLTREQKSWFQRYAPDAMRDLPGRLEHAGHRLASSVPSSIRHVGESLASHVPSSWKRW